MGGWRAGSARKIFGHHAHFTCSFRVRELRERIYIRPTLYSAILMRAIRRCSRKGLARMPRTLEVTIRTSKSGKKGSFEPNEPPLDLPLV